MALKVDPSLNPLAARERANAPSATDFRQFAALRRGAQANDPHTLREVARQFESIFTKMMLDSMRKASFGDAMFGSDQVDMYQGMMDDQLAMQLSQGRGIGLAEMLIRQLSQGGEGAAVAAPEKWESRAGAGAIVPAREETGAAGSATPAQKRRFIDELLPAAQAAARELGVDARAIVAQAALETGWGTSLPADAGASSHNYFGIKAGAGWRGASVGSATTEFTAGVAGTEQARFRAYGSLAENVADYVRVLRAPRYAEALGTGSDVHAFATALQRGGYATDPDYASKLESVFRQIAAADVNPFKSGDGSPIPAQELTNA